MKFDIGAVFEQFISMFVKLPLAQKIAIPLLAIGSMFVIVFVTQWASKAQYQTLYSNLDQADAAAIVESLKDQRISYRLRDDGKTIDVTPPERVHEVRLALASAGLPHGGNIGYEIFNESTLGQTGFVEKVKFVRALQGELERTIAAIDSVKSVRVHITQPKQSVFAKRDAPPTASVLLHLNIGAELPKESVKAIANLVANSVERLTPDNVTILDSSGKLLNEKQDEDILGAGGDVKRLQYKAQTEGFYAKKIESMLAEVMGPGKAVARVTAEIDFNKYEKEEEAFDPAGQVARSERMLEENSNTAADSGVPGVASNLTNDVGLLGAPNSPSSGSLRRENVKNYELSRSVSRTFSASGAIQKLSVAVLVDGQYEVLNGEPDADGNVASTKHYIPLTTEMLGKLENLVKQAVGFDSTRGDVVTVENIRFFESDDSLEKIFEEEQSMAMVYQLLPYGISVLVLLVLIWLVKPLINFLVKPTEAEVDLSRLLPTGIEELEAELDAERRKVSTMPELVEPEIDLVELEQLLASNSKLVRDNPNQAALLIRYWLNEGSL
jgi:flagellar M-ring protein FliF